MTFPPSLFSKLKNTQHILVTAESCTGGLISSAITSAAGSSSIFERGFVTYSNQSKIDLLDVQSETLDKYGAVSEITACEMAEGALSNSQGTLSISVTGIAGPEGGTEEKPVGTVCFGVAIKDQGVASFTFQFGGDRQSIRQQAATQAFQLLEQAVI